MSASPFLDDKGNEIPVISALGTLVLYARQLPLPVHFTEEVMESRLSRMRARVRACMHTRHNHPRVTAVSPGIIHTSPSASPQRAFL